MLTKVYEIIDQIKTQRVDEGIVVTIIHIFKAILQHSKNNKDIFEKKYKDICEFILQYKTQTNFTV